MILHLQNQRHVLCGSENFFEVSVFCIVLNLILSIICRHVYFLFLVFLFYFIFFIAQKNPKILKIFRKIKLFYFVSYFIFLEMYHMNSNISLLTWNILDIVEKFEKCV